VKSRCRSASNVYHSHVICCIKPMWERVWGHIQQHFLKTILKMNIICYLFHTRSQMKICFRMENLLNTKKLSLSYTCFKLPPVRKLGSLETLLV
jgi:hypothetical protein